jgi:hypothetical protein
MGDKLMVAEERMTKEETLYALLQGESSRLSY